MKKSRYHSKHSKQLDLRNSHYSNSTGTPAQPSFKNKKKSKKGKTVLTVVMVIISGVLLGASLYITLLLLSPKIQKKSATEIKANITTQESNKNMLYIPTAGVNAEIAEGDVNVLDEGKVWHRLPHEGNPTTGGNMILTGHSFVWGYTPAQIKKKSIFYSLPEAKVGDEVTVHWNDKNYEYIISEVKTVKPTEVSIEEYTKDPRLTIYTCTLGGSADGRVVVIARPK